MMATHLDRWWQCAGSEHQPEQSRLDTGQMFCRCCPEIGCNATCWNIMYSHYKVPSRYRRNVIHSIIAYNFSDGFFSILLRTIRYFAEFFCAFAASCHGTWLEPERWMDDNHRWFGLGSEPSRIPFFGWTLVEDRCTDPFGSTPHWKNS